MFDHYPEKENLQASRPIVKQTEVCNIRRNLGHPLQLLNPNEQSVIGRGNNTVSKTPSLIDPAKRYVNSPVTELTNTFVELAAHELHHQTTPKKRLSLSSTGSPTPDLLRLRRLSPERQIPIGNVDGVPQLFAVPIKRTPKINVDRSGRPPSSLRRFHSLPVSSPFSHEASPLLIPRPYTSTNKSPSYSGSIADRPFNFGQATASGDSRDSSDSGFGKDEGFHFAMPLLPPEASRLANETSPPLVHRTQLASPSRIGSYTISPPDLHDTSANHASDSPLLAHTLCSEPTELETDDGFFNLDELENEANSVSDNLPADIAPMLTAKLATKNPVKLGSSNTVAFGQFNRMQLFRSPSVPGLSSKNDSPAYDIRRRVLCAKRPEPPMCDGSTPQAAYKKRKSAISEGNMKPAVITPTETKSQPASLTSSGKLHRCKSMVEHSITSALSQSSDPDLIGDYSKKGCLPTIKGKHGDLKCIAPQTIVQLLNGGFDESVDKFAIIDCRYPYEYMGGHIKDAENLYTKEDLYERLLGNPPPLPNPSDLEQKRSILVFHCEFSSERAPKLSRFLRNHDRELNKDNFPSLHYPEVYLLEGGYKALYHHNKDVCIPQEYVPMAHKDHASDLKRFRSKSKSWAGNEKRRLRPFRL